MEDEGTEINFGFGRAEGISMARCYSLGLMEIKSSLDSVQETTTGDEEVQTEETDNFRREV